MIRRPPFWSFPALHPLLWLAILVAAPQASLARSCQVNGDASQVEIRVYADGPLGFLGHNHVITSANLRGSIHYQSGLPEEAGFSLALPIRSLRVDRAEDRAAAGSDFSAPVSNRQAAATRRNMLSPDVLDADQHPVIRVRSRTIRQVSPTVEGLAEVVVRGTKRTIPIRTRMHLTPSGLIAEGGFSIRQSAFGIEPLKLLGGLVAVRDRVEIQFSVNADCRKK